jgi:ribosomal protein L37E
MIRCDKCIIPETNPYVVLDEKGVCNICNYQRDRRMRIPAAAKTKIRNVKS